MSYPRDGKVLCLLCNGRYTNLRRHFELSHSEELDKQIEYHASPYPPLVETLEAIGFNVIVIDENTDPSELAKMFDKLVEPDTLPGDTCFDKDCLAQGCPEHPFHSGGDHTYEQHHSPEDHVGPGPCRCTVYQTELVDVNDPEKGIIAFLKEQQEPIDPRDAIEPHSVLDNTDEGVGL